MDNHAMFDLYDNLLRSIVDPFFVISEDGTYLDVYGGTDRRLYDDATSLKGRNIYDFMERRFAEFFMGQLSKTLADQRLHVFEYQLETGTVSGIPKDGPGGIQWFEARLFPLCELYEGYRAVTALIMNISDRKLMQQRLRDLSYQDALTGLPNRRYFFERLADQIELYARDKIHLSVLLFDIDHLKQVNDSYGHSAGDRLLRELANVIREESGPDDLLARFGDDEFILSVSGLPFERVMALAEHLHQRIRRHASSLAGQSFSVSVSIGVTDATIFDTDAESTISRVECALLRAKEEGRDRVVRS